MSSERAADGTKRRGAGGAMLRGVALIVVAVLLGVVLLSAADEPFPPDDGQVVIGAGDDGVVVVDDEVVDDEVVDDEVVDDEVVDDEVVDDEVVDDEVVDDEVATTTPSTTAAVVRSPSEVTVLVANGSGVSGAARARAEEVEASGYDTAPPANVRPGGQVDESVVFYTEGYEAEAAALAGTFSPVPAVEALPEPPPVDDLRGAGVVLILGPDLAEG